MNKGELVVHKNLGVVIFEEYAPFDNECIVSIRLDDGDYEEKRVSVSMLKKLGKEEDILNRLRNRYNVDVTDDMSLIEISDLMDDVGFSFYYVSYRDLDIIECAKEEGWDDVLIYELRNGFIGFLEWVM